MLGWNTIWCHVIVHLKTRELLHQLLLDLLLSHILESLNDYIGHSLLMLQRLAHVVSGVDVLTDGDACSFRCCLFCLFVIVWVLAMRLRGGLWRLSGCTIGLRVIIIVDVDVVIIDYLNNFA